MIHLLLTEKENSRGVNLTDIIKKSNKLKIVGVTENSIEILYGLIQNRVDLMIIDKSLKNISDSDCAGMVSKLNIDVKILLLLEDEKELATNWNPTLFAGYILKSYSAEKIVNTIEQVMNVKPRGYFVEKGEVVRQVAFN